MAVCSSCGHPISDGAQFCNKCGARLDLPVQKRRCPNASCGNELSDGALFCAKCGAKTADYGATDRKASPGSEKKGLGALAWVGIGCGGLTVIFGIVVLVMIIAASNSEAGNAGNSANTGQTVIQRVAVQNMYNDYIQNSQQAQRVYQGNRFRFTGLVTNPNPNVAKAAKEVNDYAMGLAGVTVFAGIYNWLNDAQTPDNVPIDATTVPVTLHTDGNTGQAVAEFKCNDLVALFYFVSLSHGQAITFDATVAGVRDGYILLTNCSIVE